MLKWRDPKKELPKEYEAVIIWIPNMPWSDSDVGKGIFYDIAWLVKGISEEERKLMKPCSRKREYRLGDEGGNNLVPYIWDTFGPMKYFGQEVKAWAYFDEAEVL